MGKMHGALSRPPVLFKKKGKVTAPPHPMFQPLNYMIVWFDVGYPYSMHSGYESRLRNHFPTYPFRMEADFREAVRLINTTMANCSYIVILTGARKREFLGAVTEAKTIAAMYVIEPFRAGVKELEKFQEQVQVQVQAQVFPTFDLMLASLATVLPCFHLRQYGPPKGRLLNYQPTPDPTVMTEQAVRALTQELKQQQDQDQFRYLYFMAANLVLEHFQKRQASYEETQESRALENPLYEVLSPCFEKEPGPPQEEYLRCLIHLLELSVMFDQCPYVYRPRSARDVETDIQGTVYSFAGIVPKLLSKTAKMSVAVQEHKVLDAPEVLRAANKLHKYLIEFVGGLAVAQGIDVNNKKWVELGISLMLLEDMDLCLKLLLDMIFTQSEAFASFSEPFSRALLVSDYRVSVMKEIWERAKPVTIPEPMVLPEAEMSIVAETVEVRTAVVLKEDERFDDFTTNVLDSANVQGYQFASVAEFCSSDCSRFKHKIVYLLAEMTLTQAEYGRLLSLCIEHSITPILIVYCPKHTSYTVSKEMLRKVWIVTVLYTHKKSHVQSLVTNNDVNMQNELKRYSDYYADFAATVAIVQKESTMPQEAPRLGELEAGWELKDSVNPEIFSKLLAELTLGQKTVGSLHYHLYSYFKELKLEEVYWENYAVLFGICTKITNTLDITFGKNLLKAYTLQTNPPFYKLLNDAFRGGNPEKIGKYRAFYVMLHDLVKKGVLRQHIGTVYRGTFFNPELLNTIRPGLSFVSTCFTSTSKSEKVAHEFAMKTKRNVLLEIELNRLACSNIDIHSEKCSAYPEEQEVLLLPFTVFQIKRVFTEGAFTFLTLVEIVSEAAFHNIKRIEYYN